MRAQEFDVKYYKMQIYAISSNNKFSKFDYGNTDKNLLSLEMAYICILRISQAMHKLKNVGDKIM